MNIFLPKITIDINGNVEIVPAIPLIFEDEEEKLFSFNSPDPEE